MVWRRCAVTAMELFNGQVEPEKQRALDASYRQLVGWYVEKHCTPFYHCYLYCCCWCRLSHRPSFLLVLLLVAVTTVMNSRSRQSTMECAGIQVDDRHNRNLTYTYDQACGLTDIPTYTAPVTLAIDRFTHTHRLGTAPDVAAAAVPVAVAISKRS